MKAIFDVIQWRAAQAIRSAELFCRMRWVALVEWLTHAVQPIVRRARRMASWHRDFRAWNRKRQESAAYIAEVRKIVAKQRKQPGGFWAGAGQRRFERSGE